MQKCKQRDMAEDGLSSFCCLYLHFWNILWQFCLRVKLPLIKKKRMRHTRVNLLALSSSGEGENSMTEGVDLG